MLTLADLGKYGTVCPEMIIIHGVTTTTFSELISACVRLTVLVSKLYPEFRPF